MDTAALKTLIMSLLEMLGVEKSDVVITDGHSASPGASSRGGRTVVSIKTDDSKRLIGPHGEHLRALNMLARRLVEAKMERESARPGDSGRSGGEAVSFLIDVNGYHEAQLEQVKQNARMLAQRARLFKRDVEMDPMSPYERLVVHELFSEDPEIKTVSEGEGKFRHIVLKYQSSAQPSSF